MKVITVHGTFASDIETHGDRWWQIGSRYSKSIANLDNVTGVVPLIWDGKNSESSRRQGGKKLYKLIRKLENTKDEYTILGHSHGGMVIIECLKLAIKDGVDLKYLKKWMTVGTPFIEYVPKTMIFNLHWLQYAMIVPMFIILATIYDSYFQLPFTIETFIEDLEGVSEILIIICLFFGFLFYSWHKKNWRLSTLTKKLFVQNYMTKHCVYFHENDEAIRVLSSVNNFKPRIFTPTSLLKLVFLIVPFSPILMLVYVLLFPNSGILIIDFIGFTIDFNKLGLDVDANKIQFLEITSYRDRYYAILEYMVTIVDHWQIELSEYWPLLLGENFLYFGYVLLYIFFVILLNLMSFLIAYIIGQTSFFILNGFVSSYGKSSSLGADVPFEKGIMAGEFPPMTFSHRNLLDNKTQEDILRIVHKTLANNIIEVHQLVLDSLSAGKIGIEIFEDYNLTNELIHTSYFQSKLFCDEINAEIESV